MGYLGMQLAIKKREELFNLFTSVPRSVERVVGVSEIRVRNTGVIVHQRSLTPV